MKNSTKWFLIITGILLFVGFWVSLFLYLFFRTLAGTEADAVSGYGEKIAVVELNGVILSSDETVRQLKKFRDDESIKGILLRVDSPGGGVAASQEIYEEVRKTRVSGKPVVVSMGALAASGGYYVSCPANRIVANRGTLTGSIGVISQFMRFDPLMKKLGIEENTIKSGRLKDAGSPFREMTATDRTYFQDLMNAVHRQFITAVEQTRGLKHQSVVRIADGRVFTGEQAIALGLIDTLGTYEDALEITARLAGIDGAPAIVKERKRGLSLYDRVFGESKIDRFLDLKDEVLNQPLLQYKMSHGF